jgi:maltooligosyltrehalose trehalohydrolase
MGEEYGEDAPFYFFSDYRDPATVARLLEGRKQQFASFDWEGDPRNPQDGSVFLESKLRWEKREEGDHAVLLDWHRSLIRLRREHPLLSDGPKTRLQADVLGRTGLSVYRYSAQREHHLLCMFNFSRDASLSVPVGYASAEGGGAWAAKTEGGLAEGADGGWIKLLASTDGLPDSFPAGQVVVLPPLAVAVYERRTNAGAFSLSTGTREPAKE